MPYENTQTIAPQGAEPLDDSDLCALIDRELRQSIGWEDALSAERQRLLDFYMGEATGELAPPEVEGRSSIVSKDVMDTVEWMMPSLMRMFAGSDEIVRFEPEEPQDEQACRDATEYIGYLLMRKNEGFLTLHDAIKSALIQRMGVVKVYCDKRWDYREETYRGLSSIDLEAIKSDPEVEIISEEAVEAYMEMPGGQMHPNLPPNAGGGMAHLPVPSGQAVAYDVRLRRKEQIEEFRAEGVPPEEIRIAKETRTINDCRFIAHEVERTLSDLLSLGYDPDKVWSLGSDDSVSVMEERQTRHDYDDSGVIGDDDSIDPSQRRVTLIESYLRVDADGDGIAEYRRVVKSGGVVFENDITDDHPFALFCPVLMPYKIIGLGVGDLVEDIQRIKTALTRQVLDNAYLANYPMRGVLSGAGVDMDALLNPRPGGIVQMDRPDAVSDLSVPFVAGAGLSLIEYFNGVRDQRNGVTQPSQGVMPDALSKSNVGSEGVQELINAAAQRIELVARVFAETGIKRIYLLMLKLVTQYQNRAQQAKINGRWLQIDPRAWKNQYDMTVSVGVGTVGRAQQVGNLQFILTAQKEALQAGLASPQTIYNALSRLTEAMGYRDADQFWTAPQPQQGPPQPEPPPPEAMAIIEAEKIKAQATMQKAQMDNQTRIMVEREKIQSDERVAMFEARARIELEQQKQAAQQQREIQREAARPTAGVNGGAQA